MSFTFRPPPTRTPRPDFVIVGGQSDGLVYLMASRTLSDVELAYELEVYARSLSGREASHEKHTLTCVMRDFVMVAAPTYGQAFSDLFAMWEPDDMYPRRRPAIDARRELEAPRRALPAD